MTRAERKAPSASLRVIDSSVIPSIIIGNTQAPSMMIGEKGAAMIQAALNE